MSYWRTYKVEPYHMYIGIYNAIHQDDDAMEWVWENRKAIEQRGDTFIFLEEEVWMLFKLKYPYYIRYAR